VKKKHPNITLELSSGPRGDLEKQVAAGTVPDIIFTANNIYPAVKQLGIPLDLGELIKKHNLQLDQFLPEAIETVRSMEDGKSMNAIPLSMNAGALFYNKDLFDKFGIPYPTNGMTWDQALEIARRMTRMEDSVQYIGMDAGMPDAIAGPFGVSLVDPKTMKASFNTPQYKRVFELMKQVYDLPGYLGPKGNTLRYPQAVFIGDKNVGMLSEWVSEILQQLIEAETKGIAPHWDVVTVPNFPENAGMGRDNHTQALIISSQSKYKDQAMQVIQAVTSREAQIYLTRNARIAVLRDSEIVKQFGKDVPQLQDKHVDNILKFKLSPPYVYTLYDNDVLKILRDMRSDIAVKHKDINTALREAEDAANKKLDENMGR
jgi:multiple sugar transport system substrate-binding protein